MLSDGQRDRVVVRGRAVQQQRLERRADHGSQPVVGQVLQAVEEGARQEPGQTRDRVQLAAQRRRSGAH